MIKLVRDVNKSSLKGNNVVVLGSFDGLHSGHNSLISEALVQKRELIEDGEKSNLIVVSFYPNPKKILLDDSQIRPVSSLKETLSHLHCLGADFLYLIRFNKSLAKMSAANFVQEFLFDKLSTQVLVVGEDAAVGYKGEGNASFLEKSFLPHNKKVIVKNFIKLSDQKISSRNLRKAIENADFDRAEMILGKKYSLTARVVRGHGNGKKLSFPTANLNFKKRMVPKNGVYAGYAYLNQEKYKAVCNIGVRPTFAGIVKSLEVHIIDNISSDFYGDYLRFEFVAALREECKFKSISELKEQISLDVKEAKVRLE